VSPFYEGVIGLRERLRSIRPRVLIVDDERETLMLLRAILQEAGLEVIGEAADGSRAIEAVAALGPDVVLMDVRMPGMSGLEACRRITRANPAVSVILLTAYGDANLPESAEKVGAYCYLLKDGPPSIVVDIIRRAWRFRDRSRSA